MSYEVTLWTSMVAVTPSNSTTYTPPLRGLKVATGGNVNLVDAAGSTVLVACIDGDFIPGYVKQVLSTSTTASGIYSGR